MNKLNFAIFGTGTMAQIYANIICQHPLAELVGFVGNSASTCLKLSKKYSVNSYPNSKYSDFLEDHNIDVVIIATPEWIRLEPLSSAIKFKKNIILEKPIADNLVTIKEIINLLNNYDKVVKTCHVLRYSPRFQGLFNVLKNNQVGDIRHISARRNSNNKRVKRVLGKTNLAYWLTPHDVDLIRILSRSSIKSVFAQSRGKINTADDFISASFKFKNNITASLDIFWCYPPVSPLSREFSFEVRGNKGVVEINDFDNNVNIFLDENKVTSIDTYEFFKVENKYHGYFQIMIDNFISNILDNKKDMKLSSDIRENSIICEMIRLSILEERVINAEEIKC